MRTGRFGSGKAISLFPGNIRNVPSDEKHLTLSTNTSGDLEEDFKTKNQGDSLGIALTDERLRAIGDPTEELPSPNY